MKARERAEESGFLVEVTRGVCGGCLFAFPMIYTMETWWLGYSMPTWGTLVYLAVGYLIALGLNALSGFREETGLWTDAADALVSIAIGVVVAGAALVALGEVTWDTDPLVALRQVILLSFAVSIGVSLSRAQLGGHDGDAADATPHTFVQRLGSTIAGALLLGMSVAPTEELRMVVSRVSWVHLAAMTGLSLLLAWATLFVAGFRQQAIRVRDPHLLGETLFVHAVSLTLSAAMLGGLGYLSGDAGDAESFAMVVALGLPATAGAAAGRLVL